MSTQKAKFELYQKLQALGFTLEEAAQLRRIEMTLHRWAEAECNGEIERRDSDDKPERVIRSCAPGFSEHRYPIADREAGALKRLKAIVEARNHRCQPVEMNTPQAGAWIEFYHQTDPRGCALYLVKQSDIPAWTDEQLVNHSGPSAISSPERRREVLLSCYYTRGLAVCT